MKRHGIAPSKPAQTATETSHSKWSSKKQINSNKPTLEDCEDEWDSDVDNALIISIPNWMGDNHLNQRSRSRNRFQDLESRNAESEAPKSSIWIIFYELIRIKNSGRRY